MQVTIDSTVSLRTLATGSERQRSATYTALSARAYMRLCERVEREISAYTRRRWQRVPVARIVTTWPNGVTTVREIRAG